MSIIFNNNIPFLEEQNVLEIIEKIPTPFYLYSQKKIVDSYTNLKSALKKNIFYSVKANSNQAIISLIKSLDAGIDVVSMEELHRALKAYVNPEKIIFEGVGKSKEGLEYAIDKNIRQINVESIQEIELIENISSNINKIPSIGLRVNPNINSESISKISTGNKNDKFGIDFEQLDHAFKLISKSKNINFVGLSCHVGSQIFKLEVFDSIFRKMKDAIKIMKNHNLYIKHLDLGGGFGFDYHDEKSKLDLKSLALLIETHFPKPDFEISFEPGRYIVAESGLLITKILTVKKNADINYLITDAGMQTFIRPALYNAYHRIINLNKNDGEKIYTIAGPICESSDILAQNIKLPEQHVNDFLAICDVGAYGSVMASNYNSKCLPAEILVNKNKFKVIRNLQTIENLIDQDIIPEWHN